jgi:hypothetical protein
MIFINDPKIIQILNKYDINYVSDDDGTIEINNNDGYFIYKHNNVEDIETLIKFDYWKVYYFPIINCCNLNTIQHFLHLYSNTSFVAIIVYYSLSICREDDNPEIVDFIYNYFKCQELNVIPDFQQLPNNNINNLDYLIKNKLISEPELVLTTFLNEGKFKLVDYLVRRCLIPRDKMDQIFNNHFVKKTNMNPELFEVILQLHNEGFIQLEEKLINVCIDDC